VDNSHNKAFRTRIGMLRLHDKARIMMLPSRVAFIMPRRILHPFRFCSNISLETTVA
jgi:hypothetical protein